MTLTKETKVTLGTVAAILLVGVGATWTLASVIVGQFSAIKDDVLALHTSVDGIKTDRFTLTAASEHALRTAMENPGLRVPDPRDPAKIFVVDTKYKSP